MSTGSGNFQGTLHVGLPLDIAEIYRRVVHAVEESGGLESRGGDDSLPLQVPHHLVESLATMDAEPAHDGCFRGIGGRHPRRRRHRGQRTEGVTVARRGGWDRHRTNRAGGHLVECP